MESWTWFDVHGAVSLRVAVGCPAERQLCEMLRPFRVDHPLSRADITVTGARPPLTEASHGEHAYRYTDTGVELVRDRVLVTITEDGYGVHGDGELLTSVLPLMDSVGVQHGTAMIHAATVAIGEAGICLPAWGGVGKTSTVAQLMKDPATRFMGDDWAFLNDAGRLLGYAKPMFLKPHHRSIYPHVFKTSHKPLAPSRFTDTVARAATMVHPVVIRYPRVAHLTRRWSPEHLMVHPEEAFPGRPVATDVPLRVSCFVERYDGSTPKLVEKTPTAMVTRMVGNFHAELPRTSRDLVTALGATGLIGLETYYSDKAEVLAKALAPMSSYLLRVPAAWDAPKASMAISAQVRELLARGSA